MARKKIEVDDDDDSGHHHSNHHNHGHNHMAGGPNKGGLDNSLQSKIHHSISSNKQPKSDDSLYPILKQLSTTGLTIREMPGDGNCLFRALGDQLEGHTRNHIEHRRSVVQFMRDNRPDFEPFVEDEVPFEKYVQILSQPGTFAGNDAIVAFARLHNVTVVIHQLNTPAWRIQPTPNQDDHLNNYREVHIAYHNGDHYNSVRKFGDDSETPTNIKLITITPVCKSPSLSNKGKTSPRRSESSTQNRSPSATMTPTGSSFNVYGSFLRDKEEDYWINDVSDIERFVKEVIEKTECQDTNFVREALIENNFDLAATIKHVLDVSAIINTSFDPKSNSSDVDESNWFGMKCESDFQKSDERLIQNSSSSDEEEKSQQDQNDENYDPMEEIKANPSQEQINRNKVKMGNRQKKDQKKKDRKRESNLRKKNKGSKDNETSENIVVVSNLASVDI